MYHLIQASDRSFEETKKKPIYFTILTPMIGYAFVCPKKLPIGTQQLLNLHIYPIWVRWSGGSCPLQPNNAQEQKKTRKKKAAIQNCDATTEFLRNLPPNCSQTAHLASASHHRSNQVSSLDVIARFT